YYKALDKIRQPYSAKIAIKEGGVLGKGPGQSTQRYVVPDISEDYMYSFIIEEYGLWGALIVIFLYVSLLARGSIIVRNCGKDIYAKISVAGLCLLISGQAFLHMFVNADIGPMTGQTLPLISHGNSAFLCFSLAFGLILSFSRIAQRRIEKEQREAQPLIELKENVQAGLDELDSFESGEAPSDDILDEMNDYGVQ
ncbi:MAG: FtsW/RodA/SpoVE family cell cycle protein, partial [Bacteroidales bacterium]|nr:FtsW/RodA/SpoVE family cell cycle protein [Bacteroidales bacterium]